MTVSFADSLHRMGTKQFIAADPTEIALIPVQEIIVGGTKTKVNIPARDIQTFKIIWSGSDGIVTTSNGTTRKFDFVIVGEFDAEMAIGDHWQVGEQRFVIQYLYPSNRYEIKGGGVSYGDTPG